MISCNEYDYIEIVCMYRYPIKITLKSGSVVNCIALDTQRNESREECIKVKTDAEELETLVKLSNIATLEVCIENPHFKVVSFTS